MTYILWFDNISIDKDNSKQVGYVMISELQRKGIAPKGETMKFKVAEYEVEISVTDTKYNRGNNEALSAFLTSLANMSFNSADYLKDRDLKASAKESTAYALAFTDASEIAEGLN